MMREPESERETTGYEPLVGGCREDAGCAYRGTSLIRTPPPLWARYLCRVKNEQGWGRKRGCRKDGERAREREGERVRETRGYEPLVGVAGAGRMERGLMVEHEQVWGSNSPSSLGLELRED